MAHTIPERIAELISTWTPRLSRDILAPDGFVRCEVALVLIEELKALQAATIPPHRYYDGVCLRCGTEMYYAEGKPCRK
jgi:hypothetical protein